MCNQQTIKKHCIDEIHAMNIQEREELASTDVVVSRMIEQVESSPMGKLLKMISLLPEIRMEKVQHARIHMRKTDRQLDQQLDRVLDKLLEGLLIP